jgi:beta-phosphoglucomutase
MQTPNDKLRYDMVIFDVGGTLLGFRDPLPFQEFLLHAGLPATEDDAHEFHRRFVRTIVAQRDAAQGLGVDNAALEGWWQAIFEKTWPDRPDLAEEMFRWFREDRFDRALPDAAPTLEALRELGLSLAIVSNFPTGLENLLRRLGLRDYFEFVIASAAVRMAKPDARIFDLAVSRANRPRHRLLYVGDHIGDDIEGAHGAGLDAVLIDRGDHRPEALCPRIRSLTELVDYVQPPTWPARAVIFDMDGVVLDSMPAHLLSWQRTLAPLGIELTADDYYPLAGAPVKRIARLLAEQFLGRPCSEEEAESLAARKRAIFYQTINPAFVHGILPLLHDLRGRGYRLALVADGDRSDVDASLAPNGVIELFGIVISADKVSEGKPDPEPFWAAAAHLGQPPSECLAVESAPLGIQSAEAAGMGCVALETTLPGELLSMAGADRVFRDIPTLRDWLLSR